MVGNLELLFHATGRTLMGTAIEGTVRGSGNDVPDAVRVATGVRVAFAGLAHVEGTAAIGVSYILGHVRGAITFADEEGATGSCSAVLWSLQPIAGLPGNPAFALFHTTGGEGSP